MGGATTASEDLQPQKEALESQAGPTRISMFADLTDEGGLVVLQSDVSTPAVYADLTDGYPSSPGAETIAISNVDSTPISPGARTSNASAARTSNASAARTSNASDMLADG